MSLEQCRSFFLYCSIINYGVLIFWALLTILARGWMRQVCTRLYHVTDTQFDAINLAGLTFYKTAIILLNIVPCLALYLMR